MVIALCSLLFAGIPLVTALGLSAALVVLVAVCAAITFCRRCWPWSGARIDSLQGPVRRRKDDDERPHGWARWAAGWPTGRGRR